MAAILDFGGHISFCKYLWINSISQNTKIQHSFTWYRLIRMYNEICISHGGHLGFGGHIGLESNGSQTYFEPYVYIYYCAKFHTFNKMCTIDPKINTILQYYDILSNQKGGPDIRLHLCIRSCFLSILATIVPWPGALW